MTIRIVAMLTLKSEEHHISLAWQYCYTVSYMATKGTCLSYI